MSDVTLEEVLNFKKTLLDELKEIVGATSDVTLADVNQLFESNIITILRQIKEQGIGSGSGTGLTTTQSNALSTLITSLENNKELSDENFTAEEKQLLALILKSGDGTKFLNDKGEYVTIVKKYDNVEALKAVDTSNYKGGERAYVVGSGSFEFLKDVNIVSDDDRIIRPIGIGKWVLVAKKYKDEDWRTAGTKAGVSLNPPTLVESDYETGKKYLISYAEPHSNIITKDSMSGRNKVVYVEINVEKAYNGTYQHIFLRANKHAADGSDYASLKISTNEGSGAASAYPLNIYTCTGSTPTETLIASETTAFSGNLIFENSNYDLDDMIQISAKSYEKRVQIDMFSKKKKTRMRTLFIDSDTFSSMTGIFNGISMSSTGTQYSYYGDIISKNINAGNDYKNIVCLGDSQTLSSYIPGLQGWVNQMSYLKRKEPVSVYNAGVSSDKIALAKARILTDVTPKFVSGADNICVINLGTNDLYQGADASTVINRLEDLVTTLKGQGWKVAVMTLANLFTPYVANETLVNGYIATINSWIMANSNIDVKIDLNTRLKDTATGLSNRQYVRAYDGVHFSAQTQKIIAVLVLKNLGLD